MNASKLQWATTVVDSTQQLVVQIPAGPMLVIPMAIDDSTVLLGTMISDSGNYTMGCLLYRIKQAWRHYWGNQGVLKCRQATIADKILFLSKTTLLSLT